MQPLTHQQIKKFFRTKTDLRNNIKLSFLLQSIDSGINVGHVFRLADAVGAEEIILTGRTPTPLTDKDIDITSMGQTNRIKYTHFVDNKVAINYVKKEGYSLYALEVTDKSKLFTSIEYPESVCLILGNETNGVYPEVLSRCDEVIYIPMFGKNFSLNVHVSAAVAAYQILLK